MGVIARRLPGVGRSLIKAALKAGSTWEFAKNLSPSRSSLVMALRCVLLLALVVVLASVDLVSADGDGFSGKDCVSDKQCTTTISYCDNSKKGVCSKAVSSLFSKTAGELCGECRPVTWFVALLSLLIITVVSSIICGCLCCSFCPLYHFGKCLRPSENV